MAEQSNTSKAFTAVSSQTLVTIGLGVVEIVAFSFMSRLLTKVDFGYYASISAIVGIFAVFADAGIGSAIIQKKDADARYINNAFTNCLILGAALTLILFSFSGIIARGVADVSLKVPLMLISSTLLLNSLSSVGRSILVKQLKFFKVGLINLVSLVITSVVAIILAYYGFGYYAILCKAILGSIITFILYSIYAKTRYRLALDKAICKSIWGFSGWMMASSVFRMLAQQVDKLLMPRMLSIEILGAYNRPKEFIGNISTRVNGIFDTALFPVLSNIQDQLVSLQNAFKKSLNLMNIGGTVLSLAFFFNSELLIRIFFGTQWLELDTVFKIFSISVMFNVNGRLADCYLRSLGLTKSQFYFRVAESVIKIIAVLVGFKWNMLGVAVAVVLSDIVIKLIKIVYVGKRINLKATSIYFTILKSWRFLLIVLPIMVVGTVFIPHTWAGNIILAAVFCIVHLIVFVVTPSVVGAIYKEEVLPKLLSVLRLKRNK